MNRITDTDTQTDSSITINLEKIDKAISPDDLRLWAKLQSALFVVFGYERAPIAEA